MSAAISVPVALDAIVAVLLVATIVYAVVLNRKLAALRNGKAEMEALVARFADSTAQAESGIRNLKTHANESGASLGSMTTRATGLAEDLSFLIERGSSLADRLEGAIESGRGKGPAGSMTNPLRADRMPGAHARPGAVHAMPAAEASPEEAALLKSLRGVR